MANPLKNEDELYIKLKQQGVSVDPVIWEIINHHVRNDLQAIVLNMEDLRLILREVIHTRCKTGLDYYSVISRLTGQIIQVDENIIARQREINRVLTKIKSLTRGQAQEIVSGNNQEEL